MLKKIVSVFVVLIMAFHVNAFHVMAIDNAKGVDKRTVRDVGKGTHGYFATPEGEMAIADRAYANNVEIVSVIVSKIVLAYFRIKKGCWCVAKLGFLKMC